MVTRTSYAIAAAIYTVLAIYGSLVPLEFRPVPLDEAVERFRNVPYLTLGLQSRADFVANILLFIPLAFLAMGALCADRGSRLLRVVAATVVVLLAVVLSFSIEFVQIFFALRTVSLNDVLAETTGGTIGVVAWLVLGNALTAWTRGLLTERRRPALIERLLAAYVIGFVLSELLPLDVTIRLGELAQKYREGRIILLPFGHDYPSFSLLVWDLAIDVALHVPLGALAVIGWTEARTRRSATVAFTCAAVAIGLIEAAQVFIYTRYADVTDVLVGGAGAAIGIAGAIAFSGGRSIGVLEGTRARPWALVCLGCWAAALLWYHWFPFDFVADKALVKERLPILLAVPFRSYYFGSEYHAVTQFSRKLLLALPLGVLVRLAWPASAGHDVRARLQTAVLLALAAMFFVAIETGQLLLPDRIADLTDALIGVVGFLLGLRLVRMVRATPRETARNAVGSASHV